MNCSDDDINEVHLGFSLTDHTEVGGPNIVSANDNSSLSGSSDLPQLIRTPRLYKLLIKFSGGRGLPGGCLFARTFLQQFSSRENLLCPDVVC